MFRSIHFQAMHPLALNQNIMCLSSVRGLNVSVRMANVKELHCLKRARRKGFSWEWILGGYRAVTSKIDYWTNRSRVSLKCNRVTKIYSISGYNTTAQSISNSNLAYQWGSRNNRPWFSKALLHCCLPISAFQVMGSFVLSVTERSLRTLPFIPLLLQSLLWKWKIGPKAWVCEEELGGRASTSDLSGLNKASLYPPQRSPHPNYTPDTSTLHHLLLFLTAPSAPSSSQLWSCLSLCWARSPGELHNIRLPVAFASQSAAWIALGVYRCSYWQKIPTVEPATV